MTVLVEACVDSAESARRAAAGGASRFELCSNLSAGGTTPQWELPGELRGERTIPSHVLIRPRPGDFCYAGDELATMLRDIEAAAASGVQGVVFGVLEAKGNLNRDATRRLLAAARPLSVTFHRAFDSVPDPLEALDLLVELGFDRVLTSGQAPTAEAGMALLARLVERAAGAITVLAGGGIRATNVKRIVEQTGVTEIHSSGGSEGIAALVSALDA